MSSSGLQLWITLLLYSIPGLVIGFTLHELAHAYAAMCFGDPTPRSQGRLTLDPREHIDPFGMGALLVIGFGWAKPVQFNPFYVRSRVQQGLVAAANPEEHRCSSRNGGRLFESRRDRLSPARRLGTAVAGKTGQRGDHRLRGGKTGQ